MSPDSVSPASANKWVVAFTVMFGTFMAVMDVTVVNVALPHMMGAFGQDISSITWVATSYAIAQIIMVTMSGWWSTVLGRKRLYIASMAVFILASLLAGTATSFTQMLVYRTIQGFGGGCLIPVSQAILREAFPRREQGMAMAIFGMGVVLAPAAGPIVGGWLTDHYGWPWIFYINLPVSIPAVLLALAVLRDPPYLRRGIARIDWGGIALLAVGLTTLQIVLERGQQDNWFASRWIVAGSAVAVVCLVALTFWELHVKEPVINVRLLRNVPLAAGSSIGLVFGIALTGTTFILPQFTQTLLGYSAFESGLVLAPRAFALFVLMPVVGSLFRYVNARLLIFFGLALMSLAYYELGRLSIDAGFWNMFPLLLLLGSGMPFMFVTLTTVSLLSIPREDMTHATSLYTLTRLIGGNIGYALVATLVANYTQIHRAHLVQHISSLNPLWVAFHGAAAGGFVGLGLDPSAAHRTALALGDALVNQQAAMMAYNDTSLITGLLFVVLVPLIFLLPGRSHHDDRLPAVAAE